MKKLVQDDFNDHIVKIRNADENKIYAFRDNKTYYKLHMLDDNMYAFVCLSCISTDRYTSNNFISCLEKAVGPQDVMEFECFDEMHEWFNTNRYGVADIA